MIKDSKERQIVSLLINQIDWTNAKTIASCLDISVRSVKYSISALNNQYPALIFSSTKGYKINKDVAKELLEDNNGYNIPVNFEERKSYIIRFF